jgi:hypothetical protein
MKNLATALVKAQMEMVTPKKTTLNPFFKNKYADLNSILEVVLPAFNNNGIVVLQPTTTVEGKNYVRTILMHESGEQIESLTEIIFSKQNDAQSQGSGISYARRYGLQSFVSVGSADDDGQKAVEPPKALNAEQKQNEKDLLNCKDLEALGAMWKAFNAYEQKRTEALKNELKLKLTNGK